MGLAESFFPIPKYTEFSVLCFSVRPNTFDGALRISMFCVGETICRLEGRVAMHN